MTIKLLCKKCKDTIQPRQIYENVACRCGTTEVKALLGKGYAVKGEEYTIVDDQGNEIVPTEIINPPTPTTPIEPEGKMNYVPRSLDKDLDDLLQNIDHQVEVMENLSSAGQYSPATNRDLLVVLLWMQSFAKVMKKSLK